jgi:hypothetical protein
MVQPNRPRTDHPPMSTRNGIVPTAESLLSVVELAEEVGGWPAGTAGTLVEAFKDAGLVEIVDDQGRTRAIITAPYASLRLRNGGR